MNITSYGDTELKVEFYQAQHSPTAWLKIQEKNSSELVLYAGNYVTADQLKRIAEILNEPIEPLEPVSLDLDDEIPF